MTRTIGFFLLHIEKKQSLIKSLVTLRTENSRLKELIASKTDAVASMTEQLQQVAAAERSLHDLLTHLFSKLHQLETVQCSIQDVLENQQAQLQQAEASRASFRCALQTAEATQQTGRK